MKMRKSWFVSAVAAAGLAAASTVAANPTSFVEAASVTVPPVQGQTAPTRPPRSVLGGLTIYTSRATFEGDVPGLPIETFEGGTAAPGGFSVCDAPLDATGDAACGFAAGEILTGVAFQDNPGPDLGSLILLGAGTSLNPTQALVANTFSDSFDILFDPPVVSAGMDLHSTPAPGQGPPDTVLIEVFDALGNPLGSDPVAAASGPGNFWGVTSPTPIGRIRILSNNNQAEGVDNVSFGAAVAAAPQQPVPVNHRGALLGLLMLIGGVAFVALNRR